MAKSKKYLQLSGRQAKQQLGVQAKVGGAGSGFDLSKKLNASGDAVGAFKAAARVNAIRAARKSGDKKAYTAAVLANRTARLTYNQDKLGLHGAGYGSGPKTTGVTVATAKTIRDRIKNKKINARTQRGRI